MDREADNPPSLSKLRWRCRRGMLELDVMLTRFLENRYARISPAQQQDFVSLLGCEDDQLWDWLSGRRSPDDPGRKWLVEQIRLPAAS